MLKRTSFALVLLLLAGCNQEPTALDTKEAVKARIAESDRPVITTEETDPDTELNAVDALYSDDWTVGYGWPGEYPDGFSIKDSGVILPARTTPDKSKPTDMNCPLEQGATIQQWNHDRVEADDLVFVSASQNQLLTVNTAASINVEPDTIEDPIAKIDLAVGDTVTVRRYYGEGFGEIEYNGVVYVTQLMQLTDITNSIDTEPLNEELWVMLTCHDKSAHRAWILLDDAKANSGVIDFQITGYGEAFDLK